MDFLKGDIFLLPLSHHLPCAVPITRLIGKVLFYYSGCRCELVNTGNASLSFDPNAEFLHSVHAQCAIEAIHRGRTPGFFTVALRPEIGNGSIFIYSTTHDARHENHVELLVNPVNPVEFSEILLVWQQVIRSIHLPKVADFEQKILQPDEEFQDMMIEAAVTTGICFAQNGDTKTARVVWTGVLEIYGYNQPEVLLNIGQSYSDDGNFIEAEEWLDMAVGRASTDRIRVLAHYNRGLARAKRAEYQAAVEDFLACVAVAPGFSAACNSIASCYNAMGRRDDAELWWRRCLELPPDPTDAMRKQSVVDAMEQLSRLQA